MENNLLEKSEQLYDKVFREVREQKTAPDREKPKNTGFKALPNGIYNGRLFIQMNTVSSEKSKNHGLKKYEFQLTVTEGEHKGKMAYYHHVLMPSHLAAPLPGEDNTQAARRLAAAELYLEKTDILMKKCGIDTSDTDKKIFVQKIAENNRRTPVVNFKMKDGQPYINYLIRRDVEDEENSLLNRENLKIPDGNDLPLN